MTPNGSAIQAATAAIVGAQYKLSEDEARAAAVAAVAAADRHIRADERERMCGTLVGYVPVSIGAVRDAYTAHTTVSKDLEVVRAEVRKLARYSLGTVRVEAHPGSQQVTEGQL